MDTNTHHVTPYSTETHKNVGFQGKWMKIIKINFNVFFKLLDPTQVTMQLTHKLSRLIGSKRTCLAIEENVALLLRN